MNGGNEKVARNFLLPPKPPPNFFNLALKKHQQFPQEYYYSLLLLRTGRLVDSVGQKLIIQQPQEKIEDMADGIDTWRPWKLISSCAAIILPLQQQFRTHRSTAFSFLFFTLPTIVLSLRVEARWAEASLACTERSLPMLLLIPDRHLLERKEKKKR